MSDAGLGRDIVKTAVDSMNIQELRERYTAMYNTHCKVYKEYLACLMAINDINRKLESLKDALGDDPYCDVSGTITFETEFHACHMTLREVAGKIHDLQKYLGHDILLEGGSNGQAK